MIVAIDGPAGAGKSTVARRTAAALGLHLLDTGAMYRAVTLEVLQRGLDPASAEDCGRTAASLKLAFDDHGKIQIDGRPGEPEIRGEDVTRHVSAVSAHGSVRDVLVAVQRALAKSWGGLVTEGRDTTTVVFPHADLKLFLIASPLERARRRSSELGRPEDVETIRADIERRDWLDSTRALSPLTRAPDAVLLDTDGKTIEQVVDEILRLARGAQRS